MTVGTDLSIGTSLMSVSYILAHQIGKSGVLPWVRNSYITPVQGLLFNIGCLRRDITSSLSDVRMMSVFIIMTDVDAEYFKVKLNLFKRWHPEVCKKK